MSSHALAWLIAVAAVLVGLLALHLATRGPRWPRVRIVAAVLMAVLLLVPAPVPGFDGHYAPAFLVFAFEWLFQQHGHPRPAGVILVSSALLAAAVMLLVAGLGRRRRHRREPGKTAGKPAGRRRPAA